MDETQVTAEDTAVKKEVLNMFKGMIPGIPNELIIRHGKAVEDLPPRKLTISGNITSVSRFLQKRIECEVMLDSHLEVDRDNMRMILHLDDDDNYGGSVTGSLTLTNDVKAWGINSGKEWTPETLANHIKMNRPNFESKEVAMKLHSDLKNFRAKVNREVEKKNDDRGNTLHHKAQAVESNLPETFTLCLPIFKGEEKRTFKVEVNIHPETLDCTLISPDLKDFITEQVDEIIDRELTIIEELTDELTIIEK